MKIDEFSRFRHTEQLIVDGHETFGVWTTPSFIMTRPDDNLIKTLTVTADYEGRPDKIAYHIYGTSSLYWVFIAFNNVRDTLNWPPIGALIEYPDESIVLPEVI